MAVAFVRDHLPRSRRMTRLPLLVIVAALASSCRIASAEQPLLRSVPGIRAKLVSEHEQTRSYQLVFEPHAAIMATLTDFVLRNELKGASFTALGAATDAVVGFYDPNARNYRRTTWQQQMEIVSLIGDAAPTNGGAGLHVHIGLAFVDGTMHGGHLFEAHASPTLEMFLIASPTPVHRRHDATINADLLVP
jgi:predicted DNA-binding protein with PD1-like motif